MKPEQARTYHFFDSREREVHEPFPKLKSELRIQHRYLQRLLFHNLDFTKLYDEGVIHGFVSKRDSLTHVKRHKGAGSILLLDLEYAFESTTKESVVSALNNLGAHPEIIEFLETNAFLDHLLPAGYPTSPLLFTAALLPMDKSLVNFAKANYLTYSRYADDLAFSTPEDIRFIPQEHIDYIREIIKGHGYESHKIQIAHPWSQPIEICGLSLYKNEVTIPGETVHRIRGLLNRELVLNPQPDMARVWALLGLVKHVKRKIPNSLKRYERLAKRYQALGRIK